jgi:putative transposase
LLERGVAVTYETIRCWCDKFGARFACFAKAARRNPGSTWHLDEMFVTLRGEPYLLWRAVDEHGVELDVLVQKRRDKAAGKRFFRRVLRSNPVPRKIVTNQLRSYAAAKAVHPSAPSCEARFRQSGCTREQQSREQPPPNTQAFLSCFGPIRQHFALPRHQMNAGCHRVVLKQRLATWHAWTVTRAAEKAI